MKGSRRSLVLLAASGLAACSWGYDPGAAPVAAVEPASPPASRAAPEAPGAPRETFVSGAASDDGARAIYMNRCSKCHEPFPPTHAPPAAWAGIVQKYGPRAGLFGSERARVVHWLESHAR